MITDHELRATTSFNQDYDPDPRCEDCGRSIVTRFGGEIGPQFCDSCEADFKRYSQSRGGMIEIEAA